MVSLRGVKSPKSKCDQNMYRRGDQRLRNFVPKKHFLAASFNGPILNAIFLKEFNVNYAQRQHERRFKIYHKGVCLILRNVH